MSRCVCFRENEVYIQEDECDSLMKAKSTCKMIKNRNEQFLGVKPNGSLMFEDRNFKSDNSCFLFQMYCNNDPNPPKGLATVLQVLVDKQWCVLCCTEEGTEKYVHAKKLEVPLPRIIEDSHHEAVFFLQNIKPAVVIPATAEQCGRFKLESAKWPNWYLSFKDVHEPTELVLNEVTGDVINENIEVYLISPTR